MNSIIIGSRHLETEEQLIKHRIRQWAIIEDTQGESEMVKGHDRFKISPAS